MRFNLVNKEMMEYRYINEENYYICSKDGNDTTYKTLIYGRKDIKKDIFNPFTDTVDNVIFPGIDFTIKNINTILLLLKTYRINNIFIPNRLVKNMAKEGMLCKRIFSNGTKLSIIFEGGDSLIDTIKVLEENRYIDIDINSIILSKKESMNDSGSLDQLFKMIRYDLKNIIRVGVDNDLISSIKVQKRFNQILIDVKTIYEEDISMSNLKVRGDSIGLDSPLESARLSSLTEDWDRTDINLKSPHFGKTPEVRDGGKNSKNNFYYRVHTNKAPHPREDIRHFNKIMGSVLHTHFNR